jgi:hypothetical protein
VDTTPEVLKNFIHPQKVTQVFSKTGILANLKVLEALLFVRRSD